MVQQRMNSELSKYRCIVFWALLLSLNRPAATQITGLTAIHSDGGSSVLGPCGHVIALFLESSAE